MIAFFSKFKEVAERETRVITLPQGMMGLPAGEYALVEFYCDEVDCDCRRVILQIWSAAKPGVTLATFNYGWESKGFYIDWMHGDRDLGREMHGLSVELFGQQSKFTPQLRALVEMVIREDPAYVERLKRHYQMLKAGLQRVVR
ncbi:MAG TPA: hypothetical protein VEC99_13060 [Clostridia bacterium]|nr:hypothetical protein [Clostridia bacterium]